MDGEGETQLYSRRFLPRALGDEQASLMTVETSRGGLKFHYQQAGVISYKWTDFSDMLIRTDTAAMRGAFYAGLKPAIEHIVTLRVRDGSSYQLDLSYNSKDGEYADPEELLATLRRRLKSIAREEESAPYVRFFTGTKGILLILLVSALAGLLGSLIVNGHLDSTSWAVIFIAVTMLLFVPYTVNTTRWIPVERGK